MLTDYRRYHGTSLHCELADSRTPISASECSGRIAEGPSPPGLRDDDTCRGETTTKVVAEQANIEAELLNLYLDGTTASAEWEARFDDLVAGCRKRMPEVAILEFVGEETASLREYRTSEQLN